jgi:predicted DNA-binding protein
MKTTSYCVRLSQEDVRRLEAEAEASGNTASGLARHYIRQGLEDAERARKMMAKPKKGGD